MPAPSINRDNPPPDLGVSRWGRMVTIVTLFTPEPGRAARHRDWQPRRRGGDTALIRIPVDPLPWSLLVIVALVVSFSASDLADAGIRMTDFEPHQATKGEQGECALTSMAACTIAGSRLSLTAAGFQPGSAQLPEGMARQLATVSQALREQRAVVRVEVHTDASGSAEHSRTLSQRRADAIRSYLIDRGIDPYRVHAVGMGASRPKRTDDPLAAENRRVEIVRL